MNTPNDDQKQPDNMERLKQQTANCGPGCGCNATGTTDKTRWVIGGVVLIVAGLMVVRALNKSDKPQTTAAGFANPVALQSVASQSVTATNLSQPTATETSVGTVIGGFAELNELAAKTDAVFIFVPGKDGTTSAAPATPMKKAEQMMETKGVKCGLFTLKAGSADYNQIAGQISVPGVLAIVKGRGMSAVPGEITESKLVQAYVSASSAGGCGPAAGSACCPK